MNIRFAGNSDTFTFGPSQKTKKNCLEVSPFFFLACIKSDEALLARNSVKTFKVMNYGFSVTVYWGGAEGTYPGLYFLFYFIFSVSQC